MVENLAQVQSNDSTVVQGDEQRLESRAASRGQAPPEVAGYELTRCLGRGSFGEVWSGRRLRTGQPVAVKILSAAAQGLDSFRHELEKLR
jgi:serine/threonine protein kinase